MVIYIDSTDYSEIELALENAWVKGITTNPSLLKNNQDSTELILQKLGQYPIKEVFYQIKSTNIERMLKELKMAQTILDNKLVVKIPPTEMGFKFAGLISDKYQICITAIFSLSQAIIAKEISASYIAVYINRASKLLGDSIPLIKNMTSLLSGSETKIIAASIKSQGELHDIALAGIDYFTLPYKVLDNLYKHSASIQAVEEFDKNGKYLIK